MKVGHWKVRGRFRLAQLSCRSRQAVEPGHALSARLDPEDLRTSDVGTNRALGIGSRMRGAGNHQRAPGPAKP